MVKSDRILRKCSKRECSEKLQKVILEGQHHRFKNTNARSGPAPPESCSGAEIPSISIDSRLLDFRYHRLYPNRETFIMKD